MGKRSFLVGWGSAEMSVIVRLESFETYRHGYPCRFEYELTGSARGRIGRKVSFHSLVPAAFLLAYFSYACEEFELRYGVVELHLVAF